MLGQRLRTLLTVVAVNVDRNHADRHPHTKIQALRRPAVGPLTKGVLVADIDAVGAGYSFRSAYLALRRTERNRVPTQLVETLGVFNELIWCQSMITVLALTFTR
ncbi:hypothetical protein A9310_23385 [Gordonia sp. UCD-TK1]|nr:hypothetical protein A9310_23385 [Gordonia sp. UCD-TK1]